MTRGQPPSPIDRPLLWIAVGSLLALALAAIIAYHALTLSEPGQLSQLALAGAAGFVFLALGAGLGLVVMRRRVLRSERELANNRERERTGLAEQRQLMASLLEQTQEGFWFTDLASHTTDVNPAMCTMLGLAREDILGQDIFAFVDEENARIVRAQIEERRQRKVGRYRLQLRRNDGSVCICLVQASPTYDALGALTGSIGLYTDISEQEASQEVLRETRQLLELALEGSDLSIWDWRADQGGTYLDGRWRSIRGFADVYDSQLTLEELAHITHPDDLPTVRNAQLDCMRGKTGHYDVEHRVSRADGGWMWIKSTGKVVQRDSNGQVLRMTGTNRDISPRKRAEEALSRANRGLDREVEQRTAQLRERELELRLVTEHIPAAVVRYDANLICRYTNTRYADELGRTVDDMIGRPGTDWLSERTVAERKPMMQRVFAGETMRFERPHWSDASRTMDVTLVPYFRANGVQDGYFAFSVESTERKHQQRKLEESQALLRRVFDLAPYGMWIKDREGRYLLVNQEVASSLGLTPQAMIGKTAAECGLHTPHQEMLDQADYQARTGGQSVLVPEYDVQDRHGETRWYTSKRIPFPFAEEHPDAILVGRVDITDLKLAQEKLNHFLAVLEATLESSADGIVVSDMDLRISAFNHRYVQMWNLPPHIVESRNQQLAVEHALEQLRNPEQVLDKLAQIYARPETESFDVLELKDGRTFERFTRPLRVGGIVVGRVRTFRDVTTSRRQAQALLQSEDRLRQLNADLESRVLDRTAALADAHKEMEAFSYSVSHDLRAPLRAVVGFNRLLQENHAANLDDDARQLVDRVGVAGERMGAMIDGMLSLGQLSRARINMHPLDLTAIARMSWDELVGAEPDRQVKFVLAQGLTAEGDPTLLRSLLQNLLGNAFKFTRHVAQARVEFGSEQIDGETVFVVRDNGAGFDMAYQNKLFGVFQRLHASKEFEGTGIGLATAHRIVLRHGGRIWAEGKPGAGAQFYFTLGKPATPA